MIEDILVFLYAWYLIGGEKWRDKKLFYLIEKMENKVYINLPHAPIRLKKTHYIFIKKLCMDEHFFFLKKSNKGKN